jgi:hypothetical protein
VVKLNTVWRGKISHGLYIEKKISAGFLCVVNYEHICKKFAPKINVNMIVVFWGSFIPCSVLL